jgi:hypothetical protein
LSNIFSKCYFHTYIKISTDHQFEFERKSWTTNQMLHKYTTYLYKM